MTRHLSQQERDEIIAATLRGETAKQIAGKLGIAQRTVQANRAGLAGKGTNSDAHRARRAKILSFAAAGKTTKEIAVLIGEPNAAHAIGHVVTRHGKSVGLDSPGRGRARHGGKRVSFAPQRALGKNAASKSAVRPIDTTARVAAVMDIKLFSCRWPIDDDGGFRFCAEPAAVRAKDGKVLPYCACHCGLAYRAARVQAEARS